MCAFSRIPHSVHRPPVSRLTLMGRDCLLAWHPSLGTALPGQARRMLLASYVLGNRCDSWLSALWHGFALRQHMAGGPSHWRLCLPHAAWSLWPSPGQPCPSLAYHLSLFAAHAFTFATGSHASVAGWDHMCALSPILPRVPPLAVPCLGTPPGVSPLLEDADGVLSLHFYFLTARIPLAAAQVQHLGSPARLAFGSAPLPRVAKKRPRHSCPFRWQT